MNKTNIIAIGWLTLLGAGPFLPRGSAQEGAEVAAQVRTVLKTHCYDCHNGPGSTSGCDFDVLLDTSLKTKKDQDRPVVLPGKPEQSRLYRMIESDRMPQGKKKLSVSEKALVRQWIEKGAPPYPVERKRGFLTTTELLQAIARDLRQAVPADRPHLRYFTLTHLANDPRTPAEDLRLVHAALSKALNCLSWKATIVTPRLVEGTQQTVLAIDPRRLGWDSQDFWNEVLKEYPYGLRYDKHPDRQLRQFQEEIDELTRGTGAWGCDLVHVRADWFVATALRPPLYHTLLYDSSLPALKQRPRDDIAARHGNPKRMTAGDLERFLNVDVRACFQDPALERIARAGFAKSGVSGQNRLVERLGTRYGAYWKSYDFRADSKRLKLTRYPLGPLSLFPDKEHPFEQQAFSHDGGEVLFHLPNGLLGTLLIDGHEGRIDEGPIQVVNDPTRTSGTPAILPGVSCLSCHIHGMISFRDQVRTGNALFGTYRDKVEALYPPQDRMDTLLRRDEQKFLTGLERATGPFLRAGSERDRPLKEFREPVGETARHYRLRYLDLQALAAELFEKDPQKLRGLLGQKGFQQLGLDTLLQEGGVIGRMEWEVVDGRSLMQIVAHHLGATPFQMTR